MDYYISKTDFKIGNSCHRKVWFKKNGYPTINDENEYLQYLAKGGYIVGKMAQLIYDGGIDLSCISDWRTSAAETERLIREHDEVTIYEATVYSNNKLARVDILEKKGNILNIIEVKAKSQTSDDISERIPEDYLNDVLFQVITTEEAFPGFEVKGYLFLPDKSKINEIEGLAGWFIVEEEKEVYELDELPARNASKFHVPNVKFKFEDDPKRDQYLNQLRKHSIMELRDIKSMDFNGDWSLGKQMVKNAFDNLYRAVLENVEVTINKSCKSCEYSSDDKGKNGFKECWHEFEGKDLSALELYYGGAVQQGKGNYYLDQLISNQTVSLQDIDISVITKGKNETELSSRAIRQLMQIEASKDGKEKVRVDDLRNELASWQFPLYFIDFETYTGAIPFHRGMRPYELIAFQWSCHKLSADGTLQHYEWLNLENTFPNFLFAESLMKTIGGSGTPLMWSHHENTVLRHILDQMDLQQYHNDELKAWLLSMTHLNKPKREGRLVDMAKVCERTYVHPNCKGKVSIKKILPAIWGNQHNVDLHGYDAFQKYFKQDRDGKIMDPYKTLPAAHEFLETAINESEEVVAEGTAAMRAYFELMYGRGKNSPVKKQELSKLLLQYCQLDTIAMVIIYMYWKRLAQ